MEETSVFEKFELQLDQTARDFLKETAKWAYILSIIGYVGIGLMLLLAVAGSVFSSMPAMSGMGGMGGSFGIIMAFAYIFLAVIYFFPIYYLNKFSVNAKRAFRDNDSEALTNALGYLKSHYKFIGILMLAIMVLYGLIFVVAILGGLLGKLN